MLCVSIRNTPSRTSPATARSACRRNVCGVSGIALDVEARPPHEQRGEEARRRAPTPRRRGPSRRGTSATPASTTTDSCQARCLRRRRPPARIRSTTQRASVAARGDVLHRSGHERVEQLGAGAQPRREARRDAEDRDGGQREREQPRRARRAAAAARSARRAARPASASRAAPARSSVALLQRPLDLAARVAVGHASRACRRSPCRAPSASSSFARPSRK